MRERVMPNSSERRHRRQDHLAFAVPAYRYTFRPNLHVHIRPESSPRLMTNTLFDKLQYRNLFLLTV